MGNLQIGIIFFSYVVMSIVKITMLENKIDYQKEEIKELQHQIRLIEQDDML